nr:hypothetical protein [Tanacetum cinerariifolium]
MPQPRSKLTTAKVKSITKEYGILLDLHPRVPLEGRTMDQLPTDAIGLYDQYSGCEGSCRDHHRPSFVITMFECLRFPFTASVVIKKGDAIPAKEKIVQHTTLPFLKNQDILEKTDSQREVEVEDEKVLAAKEKKKVQAANVDAKKKENKKQTEGGEGSSKSKPKIRKTQAVRKGQTASSGGTTSPTPIWIAPPAGQNHPLGSEEDQVNEPLLRSRPRSDPQNSPEADNEIVQVSSHESVDEFVHNYIDVDANKQHGHSRGAPLSEPREIFRVVMLRKLKLTCCKELKEEHSGCDGKVKALEKERDELSVVNQNQASQIQELEAELEKKNSELATATKEKLYPKYAKLFETKYPFVVKIAKGYRHSVADLLKLHPDPA